MLDNVFGVVVALLSNGDDTVLIDDDMPLDDRVVGCDEGTVSVVVGTICVAMIDDVVVEDGDDDNDVIDDVVGIVFGIELGIVMVFGRGVVVDVVVVACVDVSGIFVVVVAAVVVVVVVVVVVGVCDVVVGASVVVVVVVVVDVVGASVVVDVVGIVVVVYQTKMVFFFVKKRTLGKL